AAGSSGAPPSTCPRSVRSWASTRAPGCSAWARSPSASCPESLRRVLAPAEQPEHSGDATTDDEARHGGADDRLAPVHDQLAAPVGDLVDLRLEVVQRVLELLARLLDGEPDLGGRALGHQLRASSRARLVFCASSMARSGVGGVPFLIIRRPK